MVIFRLATLFPEQMPELVDYVDMDEGIQCTTELDDQEIVASVKVLGSRTAYDRKPIKNSGVYPMQFSTSSPLTDWCIKN